MFNYNLRLIVFFFVFLNALFTQNINELLKKSGLSRSQAQSLIKKEMFRQILLRRQTSIVVMRMF